MSSGLPVPAPHRSLAGFADLVAPYADLLVPTTQLVSDSTMPKYMPVVGTARAEMRARARAAYESGAAIREVARQLGRSYGATHTLLVEAGVCLRRRSPRSGPGQGVL